MDTNPTSLFILCVEQIDSPTQRIGGELELDHTSTSKSKVGWKEIAET